MKTETLERKSELRHPGWQVGTNRPPQHSAHAAHLMQLPMCTMTLEKCTNYDALLLIARVLIWSDSII
jgi:hypothetical protein